jgi:predicted transcriptional regulator
MIKKTKRQGNPYEVAIVTTLRTARRPLTVKKIAERSTMHWSTADKYLQELLKRNEIKQQMINKRKKWRL